MKTMIDSEDETMKTANAKDSPTMTAKDRAIAFLQDELSRGPVVPSAVIREKADALGIAWRTVERAAQELGVKVGKGWTWSLPGARIAPREKGADTTPAELPSETLADIAAALERIASTIRAQLEATTPPVPGRKLPDLRRTHGGGLKPGRWGQAVLRRCGDCGLADGIDASGYCAASGLTITWPWARRRCAAFEAMQHG